MWRVGVGWSGRWDLNPRQLAWEARTLPLSYARSRLASYARTWGQVKKEPEAFLLVLEIHGVHASPRNADSPE